MAPRFLQELPAEERMHPEVTREEVFASYGPRIRRIDHPYVQEQLSRLRDRRTGNTDFRKALHFIGQYMGYEFQRTIPTEAYELDTPLARTEGTRMVNGNRVLIANVLRAGINFVTGLHEVFLTANTGVISASRGPPPDFPISVQYCKVPPDDYHTLIVADPMLATGHTAVAVCDELLSRLASKNKRPDRLVFLSVLSAPFGAKTLLDKFPDMELWTAEMDPWLNRRGYIYPGLGDAGDRCFGAPEGH